MRIRRSLVASAMSIAMLMSSGIISAGVIFAASPTYAQSDPPPDLRMLLNLDLFKPDTNAAAQNGGDGSMLEQIQTLNALSYLGSGASAPASTTAPDSAGENTERENTDGGNTEEIPRAPENSARPPIPSEPEVVE